MPQDQSSSKPKITKDKLEKSEAMFADIQSHLSQIKQDIRKLEHDIEDAQQAEQIRDKINNNF